MLTQDSQDKDILDYDIGGTTIRGLTGISFISWMTNKLNGQSTFKAATQELIGLASTPPLGKLPESEKIRIVKKMLEIGIQL